MVLLLYTKCLTKGYRPVAYLCFFYPEACTLELLNGKEAALIIRSCITSVKFLLFLFLGPGIL